MDIKIVFMLFIAALLTGSCNDRELMIYDMKCGNLETPVGVPEDRLEFSWKLESESRGVNQTAYQILVADEVDELESGKGNMWNSDKTNSGASLHIVYGG